MGEGEVNLQTVAIPQVEEVGRTDAVRGAKARHDDFHGRLCREPSRPCAFNTSTCS
jgi:hypothetical protein